MPKVGSARVDAPAARPRKRKREEQTGSERDPNIAGSTHEPRVPRHDITPHHPAPFFRFVGARFFTCRSFVLAAMRRDGLPASSIGGLICCTLALRASMR